MKNKTARNTVDYVPKLDQQSYLYDGNDRLIIKPNLCRQPKNDNNNHLLMKSKFSKPLLRNTLLFPEDRIVRKPINQWINELSKEISELTHQSLSLSCAEQVAEIFNNAALIYFSIDDISLARELCYTQIQLFIDYSRKTNDQAYLKYVFQPWMNLSRLDRLEKNYDSMKDKLKIFNQININEVVIGNNKLVTPILLSALDQDQNIKSVVETCRLLEPLKGYLEAKQYKQAIQFIEDNKKHSSRSHYALLQEGMIVSVANIGEVDTAFDLLEQARQLSPATKHIFKLRECEIKYGLGIVNQRQELRSLCKMAIGAVTAKYININDIEYGLNLVELLKNSGLKTEAIELVYFCLVAADKLNDQVLKSDALISLYVMMRKTKGKKLVEQLMIDHYEKTQYVISRQKMLSSFPGLKERNNGNHVWQYQKLYEQLIHYPQILV